MPRSSKRKFALLYISDNRMVELHHTVDTLEKVARHMLMRAMKDDESGNYSINRMASRIEYMESWVDHLKENGDDTYNVDNVADHIADFLAYCNDPHIIRLSNRKEVNSEEKKQVYYHIAHLLEQPFNAESYV